MHSRRFDDLARSLASGASRRLVIKGLLGGAGGGLITALRLDRVAGRQQDAQACVALGERCIRDEACCSGSCDLEARRCICAEGQAECDGDCVDVQTDPQNCGACGQACSPGTACVNGSCCSSSGGPCQGEDGCCGDLSCCDDRCTDPRTDPNNCDGCGQTCSYDPYLCEAPTCQDGSCGRRPVPDATACVPDDPSYACCGGACADLYREEHCGRCGNACAAGETCCRGEGCFDLETNIQHCGGCFHECDPGDTCVDGACCPGPGTTCASDDDCCSGDSCCGGRCVAARTDSRNCGGCGNVCPPGQVCFNGSCGAPGAGGAAGPTGATGPGPQGGPGQVGPGQSSSPSGQGSPIGGSCGGGVTCGPGAGCCGGTCVDFTSNPLNCGGCGRSCSPGQTCTGGVCVGSVGGGPGGEPGPSCGSGPACNAGRNCCGGACVDLSSDPTNCGACGQSCGPGETCCNGGCVGFNSCPPDAPLDLSTCACRCADGRPPCGSTCCDQNECCRNGVCTPPSSESPCSDDSACEPGSSCCDGACVDQSSDRRHCGACGYACAEGKECCDGRCVSLLTGANCGACGNVCPPGACCRNGVCTCAGGYPPCDGQCRDHSSDPEHCGACGNACGEGETCYQGECRPTGDPCQSSDDCPDGYDCCEGTCHDLRTDPSRCGDCETTCEADPSICRVPACYDGICGDAQAPDGYLCREDDPYYRCCGGYCVNTQSDPEHCGACGYACDYGFTCCGGEGCYDLQTDPLHCGACGNACPTGETCLGGTCAPLGSAGTGCAEGVDCADGLTCCGGYCRDTRTEHEHCGACNSVCANLLAPCANVRTTTGAAGLYPPYSRAQCVEGDQYYVCCDATCTDVLSDPSNCGDCGYACTEGQECVLGYCTGACEDDAGCAPGQVCCGGECVDPTTDPRYCGSCDTACAEGELCCESICTPPDPTNCGACGYTCPDWQPVCEPYEGVDSGYHCCAEPGGTCDPVYPGTCCGESYCVPVQPGGYACCAPDGATCEPYEQYGCGPGGSCGYCCSGYCGDGFNCEPDPNICEDGRPRCGDTCCAEPEACCDGRCVDYSVDHEHCGACGTACPYGTSCDGGTCVACELGGSCTEEGSSRECCAHEICEGGTCRSVATYEGGQCTTDDDCVGPLRCCNGTCYDTSYNGTYCGSCDNACAPGEGCYNGTCIDYTCPPEYPDGPFCLAEGCRCSGDEGVCGLEGLYGCEGSPDPCCPGYVCRDNYCAVADEVCPDGRPYCDTACCAEGETCIEGVCQPETCLPDDERCPEPCRAGEPCEGCCGGYCGGDTTCYPCLPGDTCDTSEDCCAGLTCCGGTCVDTANDPIYCGDCETTCPEPVDPFLCRRAYCSLGVCTEDPALDGTTCVEGDETFACCDGACTDLYSSLDHCGQCGNGCGDGGACCNGICYSVIDDPANCGACDRTCPPGLGCYRGECCHYENEECGEDDNGFGCCEGLVCQEGSCVPTTGECATADDCPDGYGCCEGACYDLQTDPLHCGECGFACPEGLGCYQGNCCHYEGETCGEVDNGFGCCGGLECVDDTCRPVVDGGQPCTDEADCPADYFCCDETCVDPFTDPAHCGACGLACPEGLSCADGLCCHGEGEGCGAANLGFECCAGYVCVDDICVPGLDPCAEITCAPDYVCCDGECYDPRNDPRHCGGCGQTCPDGLGCYEGACCHYEGEACEDFNAEFGCCEGLACEEGFCRPTCEPGQPCQESADYTFYGRYGAEGECCSGEVCYQGTCTDRCDAPPQECTSDPDCAAGLLCVSGYCRPICTGAPEYCCPGETCAAVGHPGYPTDYVCVPGCETVDQCEAGYLCCATPCYTSNGALFDEPGCGVCTDPAVSYVHCGTCGNTCPEGVSCVEGVCGGAEVACQNDDDCPQDYFCCDNACYDPFTSLEHCGGCGIACLDGEQCVDGLCEPFDGCAPVNDTCGGDVQCCPPYTCEDERCCGGASAACAGDDECCEGYYCDGGECRPLAPETCNTDDDCPSDYGCCEGTCYDLTSSVTHCGDCETTCSMTEDCVDGQCVPLDQVNGQIETCQDDDDCPEDYLCCGGVCVDPENDPYHCGACYGRCPADECTAPICQQGLCGVEPARDGDSCDAGGCVPNGTCQNGACTGQPASDGTYCYDGNPCRQSGYCANGRCDQQSLQNGTPCETDNTCLLNGSCQGGYCYGEYAPEGTLCENAGCVADGDCRYGRCEGEPFSDGTSCDDDNPCTQNDACLDGICRGEPVICDGDNGYCDPSQGGCVTPEAEEEIADGAPCAEGTSIYCNEICCPPYGYDACASGQCCYAESASPDGQVCCDIGDPSTGQGIGEYWVDGYGCCRIHLACGTICCPGLIENGELDTYCYQGSCVVANRPCDQDPGCVGDEVCINDACCPGWRACGDVCCAQNEHCENGVCAPGYPRFLRTT